VPRTAIYQASLAPGSVRSDDYDGGAVERAAVALAAGIGSELRKPLGVAMVGGLIFSQVLQLSTRRR